MTDIFTDYALKRLKAIEAKREELLEAWIAKHGFAPDECEIVSQTGELDGVPIDRVFVRKRGDAEELRRFREREPLVQDLCGLVDKINRYDAGGLGQAHACMIEVRDFKLTP